MRDCPAVSEEPLAVRGLEGGFRRLWRWKTLLGTPVRKLRLRQGVLVSALHDRLSLDQKRRQDHRARGAGDGPSAVGGAATEEALVRHEWHICASTQED